jgi:hypothetical protein
MYKKLNLEFSSQRLPLIILAIWLAIIAALVWQRVCESPQPPIYDALSYIEKAKAFWDNVSQGLPQNPFNIGNSSRPPGTVLLSYPFGFSNDYRGFLFRSVIVPFIIWVIAILISTLPMPCGSKPRSFWPAVLAVFLLGPMPFFFQFECPAHAYWGLMDGFLASLAALAVACSGRSLMKKSRAWVVAAAAIAAFCPLVKPSGSLVLLLTAIFWSGIVLLSIFRSNVQERSANVRFWLFGTIVFFVFGGGISWMCLHSQYLSTGVITFYKQAMVILKSEFSESITFPIFLSKLYSLFGPQIIIMVILGGFLIWKRPNNCSFEPPTWLFLIASILFCLVGGWFWIVTSGFQARYFYPFALMIIVPLVIISFRKISALDITLTAFTLWGVRIACIIPAINLIGLLLVQNPNDQWQKISGVSMKIGSGAAGVQIANNLLKALTKTNKSAVVYMTNMNIENSSFYSYGYYEKIIHPSSLSYTTVLPVDWQRPSTYRIPEILAVNYILFKPISSSQQEKAFNIKKINSLGEEELIFEAFLSTLKTENGLLTMFENQFCRLSEITDKSRLKDAFTSFIKTKSWRPVFVEENEVASAIESKSNPVSITLKVPTRKINNNFETISFSGNNLIISGWGFLDGMNSDFLKSYILLKKNDIVTVFSVNVQIRKDVTKFFNKSGLTLDSTGFFIQIPSENLEKGHYQIGLYILRGNQVGMIYSEKYMDIGK